MARKTRTWTVPGTRADEIGQRDCGKSFLLTEWPADKAERWALRALFAVGSVVQDVPDDIKSLGMSGVAAIGFKALQGIPPEVGVPLLDELMECVQYVSDAGPLPLLTGTNSQIEDVRTRMLLKMKVFELHTGFSLPVGG